MARSSVPGHGADVEGNGLATVLIADDNADYRALARAMLEDEGYRVVVAIGGAEAVAAAIAERFDCILMDIRMPRVDGITACEQIRKLPNGQEIAVVFVTAQRDVDSFDRALTAGGDDFVTKPFRSADLLLRMETALRLRRIAAERNEATAQLKHQRDQLQRLELHKEQLVGFLIHDLKNPVDAIALNAQIVMRNAHDPERSRAAAARITDETRALQRMILNLLDISRAEEGQLLPVVQEIDAASLVESVLVDLTDRASAAGVKIEREIAVVQLQADPALIARVLANLIDNAIRHAPEGTRIQVAVARIDDATELRVADSGRGVPEELREAVFERFRSGSTASLSNRGLGLAFCKVAVEAHHGHISIEDGSPGAVFRVTLPHVDRRS